MATAAAFRLSDCDAVQLIELPGEVLHLVCTLLDDASLRSVGYTCRTLHHIAHLVYLGRRGVIRVSQTDDSLGYNRRASGLKLAQANLRRGDCLRAIRSSLVSLDFERIFVPFDLHGDGVGSWWPRNIRTAREVHVKVQVAKAGSSASAAAVSPKTTICSHSASNSDRYLPLERKTAARMHCACEQDRTSLARRWELFAKSVLWSTGTCRTLVVESDIAHCGSLDDELRRRLKASGGTLCRLSQVPLLRSASGPPATLQTLHLHSPLFLHPSLYGWTLRALSSLTTLSLNHLQTISPETWAVLLPRITIPNLSNLSIDLCAIRTADLRHFLSRHSRTLAHLTLGFNLPLIDFSSSSLPIKRDAGWWQRRGEDISWLGSLRSLSAPAEHIAALLSETHAAATTVLPALESAEILYRARQGTPFLINAINHDLAPILDRLARLRKVSLALTLQAGMNWSNSSQESYHYSNQTRGTSWTLSSFTDGPDIERARCSNPQAPHPSPPGPENFTTSVTHVSITLHQFVLSTTTVFALPKLLHSFDNIRHLELATLGQNCAELSSSGGGPFEKPSHQEALLHSLSRACPRLERLLVNGLPQKL